MTKIVFFILICCYGFIDQAFASNSSFHISERNIVTEPTENVLYKPFGSRISTNVAFESIYERRRFQTTKPAYENNQTGNNNVIKTKNSVQKEQILASKQCQDPREEIIYNYKKSLGDKTDEFQSRSLKNNSLQRNTIVSANKSNKLRRLRNSRRFNDPSIEPKKKNDPLSLGLKNDNMLSVGLKHINNSPTTAVYSETSFRSKPIYAYSTENHSKSLERTTNPCNCYWKSDTCGCDCVGTLTYDDFQMIASGFFPCLNFTFTMTGGKYYAFPPNFFSRVKRVDFFNLFISNSTFEYLCDPTPMTSPFKDMRFAVNADILLLNVQVRRGWNWKPFEDLRSSSGGQVNIVLQDCRLKRLTSDFSNLAGGCVDTINISNSNLEMVGSRAFGTFENMTHFLVPENKIRHLRRTDFPEFLPQLVEIDLRNNQLNNLDEDLFKNMPHLKEILLKGNPLIVLSEKTFRSVIGQANLVGISDIPLSCDCHLRWLKDSRFSRNAITKQNMNGAVCRRPPYLRGIPLEYLSKEHLICR